MGHPIINQSVFDSSNFEAWLEMFWNCLSSYMLCRSSRSKWFSLCLTSWIFNNMPLCSWTFSSPAWVRGSPVFLVLHDCTWVTQSQGRQWCLQWGYLQHGVSQGSSLIFSIYTLPLQEVIKRYGIIRHVIVGMKYHNIWYYGTINMHMILHYKRSMILLSLKILRSLGASCCPALLNLQGRQKYISRGAPCAILCSLPFPPFCGKSRCSTKIWRCT